MEVLFLSIRMCNKEEINYVFFFGFGWSLVVTLLKLMSNHIFS